MTVPTCLFSGTLFGIDGRPIPSAVVEVYEKGGPWSVPGGILGGAKRWRSGPDGVVHVRLAQGLTVFVQRPGGYGALLKRVVPAVEEMALNDWLFPRPTHVDLTVPAQVVLGQTVRPVAEVTWSDGAQTSVDPDHQEWESDDPSVVLAYGGVGILKGMSLGSATVSMVGVRPEARPEILDENEEKLRSLGSSFPVAATPLQVVEG